MIRWTGLAPWEIEFPFSKPQTRGWFYTLTVISTALFDRPAFKNVIVNGLVLASDGKKMSKRLLNYPDPEIVINAHGADALRMCDPLFYAQVMRP